MSLCLKQNKSVFLSGLIQKSVSLSYKKNVSLSYTKYILANHLLFVKRFCCKGQAESSWTALGNFYGSTPLAQ